MEIVMLLIVLGLLSYIGCKSSIDQHISRNDLLIGWIIKLLYSFLYLFIFTYVYGNGSLYGDSGSFFPTQKF